MKKTAAAVEAFLQGLREGDTIALAARLARVKRETTYRWRKKDPEFAAAWDDALEEGNDALEDEAFLRAVKGVGKPVFYKGKVCGHVQKYSDSLLMFLLKARRPDKFRENVHISGKVERGPKLDYSKLSDEELEIMDRILSKAQVREDNPEASPKKSDRIH